MARTLSLILVGLLLLGSVLTFNSLKPRCPQPGATTAERIALDPGKAAEKLAQAVRFPTVSYQDAAQSDTRPLLRLHTFLRQAFPVAHRVLEREVVNGYSLLYTWRGADETRKPVLLLAHLDVVPVESGTEERWTYSPFSGRIADGFVWGRGSMDLKVSVLGILEAVEQLVRQGFQPGRTVYLAFGHDEETGGLQGAAKISELLGRRGVRAEYLLDEGLTIGHGLVPGVSTSVALVGIAEKGRLNVELTARSGGGHASMPPQHTAIGILSAVLSRLEATPMPAALTGPVRELLMCTAPQMSFPRRAVVSNLWLFEPLIRWQFARSPSTNAVIRTTTAVTVVRGGAKENVLPAEAKAIVNFRILPGDNITAVLEHVRRTINDPGIEIRPLNRMEPSGVSSTDSESFRALAATIRQVFPDTIVAPGLMIGGSDSQHYLSLTDAAYRFLPLRLKPEDLARIHGINERIAVDNYAEVIRFYFQLIRNTAS